ncbi:MAG: hypothetical protein K8R44_05070, partial [Sulfurimonas sp.]|nr:hypothetical protein [Sulfurimonas sp.]
VDPDPTTLEEPVLSYDRKQFELSWAHNCPEGYTCSYALGKTLKDGSTFDEVYSGEEKIYLVTETGTYYYKVKVTATQDNNSEYSDSNVVSVRIR